MTYEHLKLFNSVVILTISTSYLNALPLNQPTLLSASIMTTLEESLLPIFSRNLPRLVFPRYPNSRIISSIFETFTPNSKEIFVALQSYGSCIPLWISSSSSHCQKRSTHSFRPHLQVLNLWISIEYTLCWIWKPNKSPDKTQTKIQL